jgi:predicted DNA-binding protein with PD1-like motif
MAQRTPQIDEKQVKVEQQVGIAWKSLVCVAEGVSGGGDQAKATKHAADVSVHGEEGPSEREQEDDGRRLRSNAARCPKPGKGFLGGHPPEEARVEAAGRLADPPEHVTDRPRLLGLEPGDANGGGNVRLVRAGHALERAESFEQGGHRAITVQVSRVLRQDRRHERLERTQLGPTRRTQGLHQSISNPLCGAALHSPRIEERAQRTQAAMIRRGGGLVIEATNGRESVLRLVDGEDLILSLCGTALDSAVIVCGIGMVRDLRLGYWNGLSYEETRIEEPVELLSMQGTIAASAEGRAVHCHVAVAARDGVVRGGHLLGAIVANTAEIALLLVPGIRLQRLPEKSGLLALLPLAEQSASP